MGRLRTIPAESIREHEAVRSLHQLGTRQDVPDCIEELKSGSKGAVYRLRFAGGQHAAVIAKRCRPDKGARERAVYEEVLPQLGESPLVYFGSIEGGAWTWLFLEDVGDARLDPSSSSQLSAATRWFGQLHAGIDTAMVRGDFPDRGPAHYACDLASLRLALGERQRAAEAAASRLMARLAEDCGRVEDLWSRVERLCRAVPRVFSHNDCLPKNVHITGQASGERVVAFDWGGAGWAPLGTDLGLLALPDAGPLQSQLDTAAYLGAVASRWPETDAPELMQLALVGELFWALKVARRTLDELALRPREPRYLLDNLAIYREALQRSAGGLEGLLPP